MVGFDQLSNEINVTSTCEVSTDCKFLTVENFPGFHKFVVSWKFHFARETKVLLTACIVRRVQNNIPRGRNKTETFSQKTPGRKIDIELIFSSKGYVHAVSFIRNMAHKN